MTTSSHKSDFISKIFAPPQRLAALLPDGRFFIRPVEVAADASLQLVAEQVEIALETLSPFPLSQLYHGLYWRPGSPRALVFAGYRKRFSPDETASWPDAEIVMPAFAVLLAAPAPAGTTRVLMSSEAVTVFHWGDDTSVPTQALIHPLAPDTPEADRLAVRDQMLRTIGAGTAVEEWQQPELRKMSDSLEATFAAGENEVVVPTDLLSCLDIRDKAELAERNQLHRRDIWLWRGCLALLAIAVLGIAAEAKLSHDTSVFNVRKAQVLNEKAQADEINAERDAAKQIETVTARRLLPLEILNLVSARRPTNTYLTKTDTSINVAQDTYTIIVTGVTPLVDEIDSYMSTLENLPDCTVSLDNTPTQQQNTNNWTFVFKVIFASSAVHPEPPIKATPASTVPAIPAPALATPKPAST